GAAAVAPVFEPGVRLSLGVGFAALTLLALAIGYRRSGTEKRAWLLDAGEVALLWWFFWVVPPLVAVGVYFA
ncbi:MAG: hypothetical protein GWN07_08635, partial [Actinobacteria bacterium]|nr:hypothetical protein [Actinomycetota bacterium]NIU65544.1 hypothetical protein [Actinomycetota bacterium]NIW27360.1 hypothetical protein [Actinomycetota bacterium]NIX19887.1 hypothetical protein [Actinomycetota bacterium]